MGMGRCLWLWAVNAARPVATGVQGPRIGGRTGMSGDVLPGMGRLMALGGTAMTAGVLLTDTGNVVVYKV
jgi:hypothetical protein